MKPSQADTKQAFQAELPFIPRFPHKQQMSPPIRRRIQNISQISHANTYESHEIRETDSSLLTAVTKDQDVVAFDNWEGTF